jgi:DNA topoisomerase-6 subunit B
MDSLSNTARKMAEQSSSTSVASFFQQNRQFLGFGSRIRCILMTLKELVDNSLDICNQARILPQIIITIKKVDKFYEISVRDNGTGIVPGIIPDIFGRFLYGSKFESAKQNRGQQGIGAAAVTLESLSTTGESVRVISKLEDESTAVSMNVTINTATNEPIIHGECRIVVDWTHGTSVSAVIDGIYISTGKRSILEWLNIVSIVNPDATFELTDPDGCIHTWNRVVHQPRQPGVEIAVHPNSITLDKLKKITVGGGTSILECLQSEVYGLSESVSRKILSCHHICPLLYSAELSSFQLKNILQSLHEVYVKPSLKPLCLIEGKKLLTALTARIPYKHIMVATSQVKSEEGRVFVVEGGFVYDKEGSFDQKIEVIRIANNVPLMFQPGACFLNKWTADYNWKNTGLSQTKGELPYAPAKLFLHLASVKVRFTSESKDAIAENSVIAEGVNSVLKNINHQFLKFRNREKVIAKNKEKQRLINFFIPALYSKLSSITSLDICPRDRLYCKIINAPLIRLKIIGESLYIRIMNITGVAHRFEIQDNNLILHKVVCSASSDFTYYQIPCYANSTRLIVNEENNKSFFIKGEPGILL